MHHDTYIYRYSDNMQRSLTGYIHDHVWILRHTTLKPAVGRDCSFPLSVSIETTSVSLVADIEADTRPNIPSVRHIDEPQ